MPTVVALESPLRLAGMFALKFQLFDVKSSMLELCRFTAESPDSTAKRLRLPQRAINTPDCCS